MWGTRDAGTPHFVVFRYSYSQLGQDIVVDARPQQWLCPNQIGPDYSNSPLHGHLWVASKHEALSTAIDAQAYSAEG